MKSITINTPDDERRMTAEDWQDLQWLLRVLDEWLLYAEPSTLHELKRSLQSVGSSATPPQVLRRLGELRRRFHGRPAP